MPAVPKENAVPERNAVPEGNAAVEGIAVPEGNAAVEGIAVVERTAVPERIAAHAAALWSDACALAECAERLREIETRLEVGGTAPQWLRESVHAHLTACVTAVADLTRATNRLRRYAERTRS